MSIPDFKGSSFTFETKLEGIGFSGAIGKTKLALKT